MPRPPKLQPTEDLLEFIFEERGKRTSWRNIAKFLNIANQTLTVFRKKHAEALQEFGIDPGTNKPLSQTEIIKFFDLYRIGESIDRIEQILQINSQTLYKWLDQYYPEWELYVNDRSKTPKKIEISNELLNATTDARKDHKHFLNRSKEYFLDNSELLDLHQMLTTENLTLEIARHYVGLCDKDFERMLEALNRLRRSPYFSEMLERFNPETDLI